MTSILNMPDGLRFDEQLAYRHGFVDGFGKYLKTSGSTPAIPGRDHDELRTHAAAWHAVHDNARQEAAEKAGIAALKRYWKTHGVTDRGYLIGEKPRAARRTPCCEHCSLRTENAA